MRRFRDWPIGRKVSLVVMITSTIVLLLTCSAFLTYEWITFRRAALRDLTTLGQIIGDNSTAALRFRSETEAGELLATLKAEETIVYAGLYDSDGRLFASYSRDGTIPPSLNESDLRAGHRFTPRHLFLYQNVMRDDHKLGTLYIQSSLATVQKRFLLYGGMALLILLGSYLVAWILSSRLQQRITGPIHELARTARAISTGRDYSMRASRYGNDELGELTDSFNDMLVQIKERDERISANEERLLVALAAAEMGTWRFYPERQETIVDENLRRLLGLPQARSGSSAENLFMYIFPEDRARVREALNRPLQGGRGYFAEYRIIRPDGAIRWVRDRGKIVLNPDREVAYVTGALVDITDRKEAEQEIHRLNADLELRVAQRTAELAQTNLDLEAFTYSVSHDLRAPLRHMAGYAQILKDDHSVTLSSEAVFYLERIVQGAGKLSRLIEDLLNLGKVGRQSLVMQMTELDELVDFALRDLETEIRDHPIIWQRQPLPAVKCDAGLITQVFVNLLSNAVKYSRQRKDATIAIGTTATGGETAIFVRDNGVGFDPAYKDKLFGIFQRLHSSAAFEGNGVGLATVERIVRNHGGRIWADAQPDQGATFYFTLPGM